MSPTTARNAQPPTAVIPIPEDPGAHDEHNAVVAAMEAAGPNARGRWVDPVTGRELPRGKRLKCDPNRRERRLLAAWRGRK